MILTQKQYNKKQWFSAIIALCIDGIFVSTAVLTTVAKENLFPHLYWFLAMAIGLPFALYYLLMRKARKRKKLLSQDFPCEWETILQEKVAFYNNLNEEDQCRFKQQIQIFLGEHPITGIQIKVDDELRLLVAASALIPVFQYPHWEYTRLSEVIVYPRHFNEDFDFKKKTAQMLGLVGIGNALVVSKPALYRAFRDPSRLEHVGIHEFAHKIDQEDGVIDGVPALLMDKKTRQQWETLMKQEMLNISRGYSDINPYGVTNEAEFFAVVSEYYFQHPQQLSINHPQLFEVLSKIYGQDKKTVLKAALRQTINPFKRYRKKNMLCPCGSDKKYKDCCMG